jgi:hypothetical protein
MYDFQLILCYFLTFLQLYCLDIRWNTDIKFFADLGSKAEIAESCKGGDDTEFERKMYSEIKLYRYESIKEMLENNKGLTGSRTRNVCVTDDYEYYAFVMVKSHPFPDHVLSLDF